MISGEEDIGKGDINKMIILENGDMMVVPEQIFNVCQSITKLNQQKHSSMSTLKNLMVEELIRKGCETMDQFNSMVQPYLLIYVRYVAVGELLALPDIQEEILSEGGPDLFEMYKLTYSRDDGAETLTEVALIGNVAQKDDRHMQKKSRNSAKTNEAQGNKLMRYSIRSRFFSN